MGDAAQPAQGASMADSPLQTPVKGFAQRQKQEWEELPAPSAAYRREKRTRLMWALVAILPWGVLRAGVKMDDGPTSESRSVRQMVTTLPSGSRGEKGYPILP